VRVLQSSCGADLSQETVRSYGGRQLRAEHLERDQAIMPDVADQVNGGHTAPAQLALDLIAVSQGLS
jgi:hypothetical protein